MNTHFFNFGSPCVATSARLAPVLALTALLSACGGGSDGNTTLPPPAAQPASPNPSIVSTVATPTNYPPNSEELSAYQLLNAERERCGFGLLASNISLDRAARAHADYLIINSLNSHLEDANRFPEGFTGTDPAARVRAQGYTDLGGVTDEFAFFTSSNASLPKRGIGVLGIRALLNAPYHLNGLMSGYRDVGVAVRSRDDTGKGQPGVFVQINAAYTASAGPQRLGSNDVQTYPCEGTGSVNPQLSNETPNPVPGRDLRTKPLGSTVYIAVREGNRLAITSAAMFRAATGEAVALRAPITSANDPYGPCLTGCFGPHQAYVVPDAPLLSETGYTVMLSGTNNGTSFSRNFTFSTGSGG
ncbi:MAG: CAP domain-containing protein [Polaromonas sp.]|nr:CAP domain-containing protein [Polaromonas sp.]